MTYSSPFKPFVLTVGLILSGCGDGPKAGTIAVPTESDYQIRVTADLETPGRVNAITFVPNSAASWLGAIILLTEDGALYRTDGQSSKPVKISDGTYKNVFGLTRQALPGVFFALDSDGSVDAFIEVDDAGNFGPLPLSFGGGSASQFCTDTRSQADAVWVIAIDGSVKKLGVTVQDNKIIELTGVDTVTLPKNTQALECAVDNNGSVWIQTDKGLFESAEQGLQATPYPASTINLVALPGTSSLLSSQIPYEHILLTDGNTTQTISLSDGLSIRGLDRVSYVTVTDANLGSTFSDGVFIAVDADSQRLVMVAREFLMSELKANE